MLIVCMECMYHFYGHERCDVRDWCLSVVSIIYTIILFSTAFPHLGKIYAESSGSESFFPILHSS